MIHLVTASDEAYLPGLKVTVVSSLLSVEVSEEVTVHILDGGLRPFSIKQLRELCAKIHQKSSLVFHHINQEMFSGWRPGPHGSMMTYARLLLGSLIDASRVIYLDVDMLVLGNLKEIWDTPMKGLMALGCYDGRIAKLGDDSPWSLSEKEKELPYVNAGFLLLDLEQWRAQKMEEQALASVSDQSAVYQWWDQTILNYLLRDSLGFLPRNWNWQERTISLSDASEINLIHFKSKKPWFLWSGDLRFRLWRSFYQTYIGSVEKLFCTNGAWKGFFHGIFEIQIRRHSWFRRIYVQGLTILSIFKKKKTSLEYIKATINYYTEGLGGKKGDTEFAKNQPALKKILERINIEA